MQLPLSVLTALEGLINPLLRQAIVQGGTAAAAFEKLQGSCIEFRVSGLNTQLRMQVAEDGLYLYRQSEEPADAWIMASAQDYLKMATGKNVSEVLSDPEVSVGGNTHLLEVPQELIVGLGLDTQELIARVTGPLPLTSVQAGFNQLLQFGRRFSSSASEDIKSYLDDEAAILPGQNSWHLAEDALHELRLDIDRLEARINLLEEQLQPNAGEK